MIWFLTNKDEEKIWEALKNNAYIVKIDQSDEPGGKSVLYLSNGDTIEVMNGKDGDTGASITVESVSESTEDGGSNVVIFSDGNKLTIKNGSKGAPGPQGPQGKDYVLTDMDKAEIAAAAAELVDVPVSPKDYGAGGLGTTDDTEAFRQALAENRIVHVPGGRYVLSDTLVVRANCCLELSQDTVLEFVNEEKNAITLLRAAHLRGNHATITVPYTFSANVINCDTGEDEAALDADATDYEAMKAANNTAVPPFVKWDPQWKMTRYVTDINICKPDDRGFHYSKDGDCYGTAISLHCDAADFVSYMWGVSMSGVRIAGGFEYGIRAYNIGDAWNHDMRIEALIDACKVGVSMENCHLARLAVTIQPRRAYSDSEIYKAYAEHGIILKNCRGIDLSSSRVWDWNAKSTLWAEGNYYQHIAMIGDCSGLILDDFLYHWQPSIDIRKLIYTDTPSNLENMTILQEPIDRWFKTRGSEPYFYDGYRDRKLVSQEEMDAHFGTDFIKNFTDVLATAEDTDGTVLNGVGYKIGARLHENGTVTESAYYGYTGFIPCAKGSTIYAKDLSFDVGDDNAKVIFYDAEKNYINHVNRGNIAKGNNYYAAYKSNEDGFSLTVNNISNNNNIAYARFTFYKTAFGESPMMAVDEEIKYTVQGFLADTVKVKAKNVVGLPDGGAGAQSDWSAAEGEPGHVLSRTHYEDADGTVHKLDNKFIDAEWMATKSADGEEEEILPERTISFTSNYSIVVMVPTYKFVDGERYAVHWNGTEYICTAVLASSGDVCVGNAKYHISTMENTGEPFCFTEHDGGGNVYKSTKTAEDVTAKIVKLPDMVPSKLPTEFLPDDVVLRPTKAEVGQTIVVKSVDENGKPTEWEAVDFPEGGGGGNISVDTTLVEPAEDDIPKVFFGGALQQTKDEAVVPFRYISKTQDVSGYAEIKAQGNSSMSYPKKNQTVKLYKDEACTEKLKVDFKGWGKQNKFCFKANWIDLSHARNVVSARLWADVVKSRANYAELPELLRTTPNQGAMDGFPIKVYADGVYQGRYTLNIPKDKWAFNMDDELDNHCVLCGENYASGCFRAAANINESDWTDEIHDTVPTSIKTRWNEVISFVMNSTDEEFKANLGNYFDVDSLIDYHLFGLATCGFDAYGKNQLYLTYDGQKWIASMYDMDSTWGLYWNGSKFVATDYPRTSYEDFVSTQSSGEGNLLYIRLEALFYEKLKARWTELRNDVLTIDNVINRFERFTDIASADLVKEDYASTTGGGKFTGIPSQSTNNIQQIRAYALARLVWTDEYVENLTPAVPVPCTGITLSTSTLTFTAEGTQTLTATVTPDGCTDAITWESDNQSIATVVGGVVTAIANGSTTVTATCGEYTASCVVSVSGIAEPVACTGISLSASELTFTAKGTQTLTATVQPTDTTDNVVWSSDAPDIASVENGVVTAKENGNATITATCGEQSATCAVSVSGIASTLVYRLDETEFDATYGIDTGIKLQDEVKDYTVFMDFTPVASETLSGRYTLIEQSSPSHPWPGWGLNAGAYIGISGALSGLGNALNWTWEEVHNRHRFVIRHSAGEVYVGRDGSTELTKASVDTTAHNYTVKIATDYGMTSKFFYGTIHSAKIWLEAKTNEECLAMVNS